MSSFYIVHADKSTDQSQRWCIFGLSRNYRMNLILDSRNSKKNELKPHSESSDNAMRVITVAPMSK